jgi:hypothetical protein
MPKPTTAAHTVPAALITHSTAVIRGRQDADLAAYHPCTTDARLTMAWGGVLITVYSAGAAQLPREIPSPPTPYEVPFARPIVAMEWTRRPAYAVVPQSGPYKTNDGVIHWVDLHMGPITWQIRHLVGLRSATELLRPRLHHRGRGVFGRARLRRRRSHRRGRPVARVATAARPDPLGSGQCRGVPLRPAHFGMI